MIAARDRGTHGDRMAGVVSPPRPLRALRRAPAMELRQILSFLAVARTGSFSESAKSLFLTQSGVSVQIKKLESELNTRLFDRLGRKVRLTAAGEQFQPHAEQIRQAVENAAFAVAGPPHLQRGTIRLSAPPSICAYFLPPVLKKFIRRYPQIRMVLDPATSPVIIDSILSGTTDAGIVTLPCSHRRLVVEDLFADPLRLAVHPAHPLARQSSVDLKSVARYPFISLDPHTVTGASISTIFNASSVNPNIILECRIFDVVKRLIQANVGIAVLPRSVVMGEPGGRAIKMLRLRDPEAVRRVGMVRLRDKFLSTPVAALLDLIREAGARVPPARKADPGARRGAASSGASSG